MNLLPYETCFQIKFDTYLIIIIITKSENNVNKLLLKGKNYYRYIWILKTQWNKSFSTYSLFSIYKKKNYKYSIKIIYKLKLKSTILSS